MSRKIYLLVLMMVLAAPGAFAQATGTLKGKVTDADTGEPLPFVNVVAFQGTAQIAGTTTDFDGNYTIKPINAGTYDIVISFVGYNTQRQTGVNVTANKIAFANASLTSGVEIDAVEIVEYEVPLIDRDGGPSGATVTREDIEKMPGRDATALAQTVAGVASAGTGGGISIRGSRPDGTWIYIDGIKVRGSSALPKSAIQDITVMTGGIPANIGDATGGVMNISLRNASSQWFGGVEFISSGFRNGETAVGLDRYGFNLAEGVISGPLAFYKDEDGNKTTPMIGLFVSANYQSQVDPRPAMGGVFRMKDEFRQDLFTNPMRPNITSTGEVNGALFNADFLGPEAFETVPTRLNVGRQQFNMVAKIDAYTKGNTTLTFGGTAAYTKANEFSYSNMLMNHENNTELTALDWRVYGKFSQRFLNDPDEATASNLSNLFYTVMVDYSQSTATRQDPNHQDNFFRYGHVGTFDVYQQDSYEYNFATQRFVQNGWEDTLVVFTPSPYNPQLAAVNNQFFNLFDQTPFDPNNPGPYANLLRVQNGNAILNGQVPPSTYNLWSQYGTPSNNYFRQFDTQVRLTGMVSVDIGDHALQGGFEVERRSEAFYSLAPVSLWLLARLYGNSHIQELNFNDSTVTNIGTEQYVNYERLIGAGQFEFDRNLRLSLGLDPNGNDFINTDALDPSQFSIDMFGADDLLNQGQNIVNYSGFDHHGNRLTGRRPTIEDFFNARNEDGYRTRPIGAYEPIYIAGYIMDKFTFDDIIFNVGVRVDRFDANHPVLRDPFVIGNAYTVGDIRDGLLNDLDGDVIIPSNISDDFVVYVDDIDNPSAITGYRTGETWFNAQGTEILDPDLIASTNGFPAPWLVEGPDAELNSSAFRDYTPQINVMPRIAFSFNISDEAVFFAHYDILTQRPLQNNRFSPIDYLFIEARNVLINNPDLRPTKTIDYELGFQQVLSRTSSLKISAFYREMRDMIQVRLFPGAHPRPYRAFGNLDFGTSKGLTVEYDMRRTGNLRLNGSYTLQFADGTGSTTTTALALINAGLPNLRTINPFNFDQRHRIVGNLDYRYGSGNQYNGPVWFDKQIFANTGINFIANLGSGTPYTASNIPVPITGEVSPSTQGSINGSRLPWQFNLDINIDRNFQLMLGKDGEKGRPVNLNVYLWVLNALNTTNINSVYRFTGVADDDGFLNAAQYQPLIASQNDPDSFRNYYSMFVANPFNLGLPRQIRVGVKLDF